MPQHESETTPLDRPLRLSDINDVRVIVQGISQRQLEFFSVTTRLTKRVDTADVRLERIERKLWLPALVGVVAAAMAVLARVVP
jgi:hypothetical protein